MDSAAERPPRVLVAPLVPLALAMGAGIVADRFGRPWGTATWAALALVLALAAVGGDRRAAGDGHGPGRGVASRALDGPGSRRPGAERRGDTPARLGARGAPRRARGPSRRSGDDPGRPRDLGDPRGGVLARRF